jgi:hypothetical protein
MVVILLELCKLNSKQRKTSDQNTLNWDLCQNRKTSF